MLNETQILLLNNLIYRDEFSNSDKFVANEGQTIETILENISNSPQQTLTEEEWEAIYEMAKSDSELLNLRVTHMNYEPETGAKMACFVDENNQAYAVFAGTGANEWRDDCIAGTMEDSPQQEKALEWFNELPYDNITVSGHSKGGNKAMYVAVVSDKAGECFAFDGEGFSIEFCKKYETKINEKKHKIHLRANHRDFVNVLLINIAGDTKYITNDVGISNAGEYHAPNALFKYVNGEIIYSIGDFGEQDPTMEMLNKFTEYLLENATEAEKILALSVLGELLTKFLGGSKGVVREDILDMFVVEGIEIILRYLTRYLQELAITEPLTFAKYKMSIGDFSSDAIGSGFWQFLIGNCLIEPMATEVVFDNIANGNILRIYKTSQLLIGGNVRGRDFSDSIKEIMINAAKETEEEEWWQVTKWDCWYKIEHFFGGMQWDQYTGKVDDYYRKLIDMNDSSVKEIEKIFSSVYRIDSLYARRMKLAESEIEINVLSKLRYINDSITPKSV